jgi:hypothetical protein
MNRSLRYVAATGLIGGGCWLTSVWGQQTALPAKLPAADDAVPAGPVVQSDDAAPKPNNYGFQRRGDVALGQDQNPQSAGDSPAPTIGPDAGPGDYQRPSLDPIDLNYYYGPVPLMRRPWGMPGPNGGGREASKEMRAFKQAVDKLRIAKEGPDKEAAKKELAELLDRSFTRDLEHREKQVAEIESRVKKLREQIERRKKAKDEIVGLRLKTIVNETEGLGFPGSQDFTLGPVKHSVPPGVILDAPPKSRTPTPSIGPDEFAPRHEPLPSDQK